VLTAQTDGGDPVEAAQAIRGPAYRCRGCGAAVVLKAGRLRIAHFAHQPDAACAFAARMSLAHLTAQRRMAEALRARGVHAELEAAMKSPAGDRRIDVLAWPPERPAARIAVEIQASDLTAELIEARTRSYNAEGIAPLWLRLIDFRGFERVQTLPFRGTVWIEQYRARAWEQWAHAQLGGRLWFLDAGTFLAWRGTFVPAHSRLGGDRWREVTQWVDLELDGPFELSALRLMRGRLKGADGAGRLGAWFVGPGERQEPVSAAGVRVEFRADGSEIERWLLADVGGRWVLASPDGARSDWRTVRPKTSPVVQAMMSQSCEPD
jgi:hypothetical protein